MSESHNPLDGVPIVGDAVGGAEDALGGLVHSVEPWSFEPPAPPTSTDAAQQHVPVGQEPTPTWDGVPMGGGLDAGTQNVLNFAHALDASSQPITDVVHTVDSGQHITDQEMKNLQEMGARDAAWGNALSILNQSDAIQNSVTRDENQQLADRAGWDAKMAADETNIEAQKTEGDAESALHKAEHVTGEYTG